MNDWTTGTPQMVFQHCPKCNETWYFARRFCPRCGAVEPQSRTSTGRGRVYAITTVVRAPSAELRALAPYRIALVDMDEGFRAMTHAGDHVALGDLVQTRFVTFGTLTIPRCDPVGADP
jgi:uncharacterized OB-fold protein